jgi:hypothetical protein
MKLNLMTLLMVGAAGVAAWFLMGKPTSFAAVQAGIGSLVGKVEGAVGIGGGSSAAAANFAGGWVGSVGNPHFNARGFDRPGIPGFGYGRSNFFHPGFHRGPDFDDRFRGTGWGVIPGYGFPGYGLPGPWYGNPYDRRFHGGFGRFGHPGFRGHGGFHGGHGGFGGGGFSRGGGPGGGFSASGPGYLYQHGGGPGGGESLITT